MAPSAMPTLVHVGMQSVEVPHMSSPQEIFLRE
jgi:hypothetical protein